MKNRTRSLVVVTFSAWMLASCSPAASTQTAEADDVATGDVAADLAVGDATAADSADVAGTDAQGTDAAGTDAVLVDTDVTTPEDTQVTPQDVVEVVDDALIDVADVSSTDVDSATDAAEVAIDGGEDLAEDVVPDAAEDTAPDIADDTAPDVADDVAADDVDADNTPDNGNPPCGDLVGCQDGSPCTDDSCVDGVCLHVNNTEFCTDGDNCTDNICAGGKCTVLGATNCDDGNACTLDACVLPLGCSNLPQSATPCDDGNASTGLDTCISGTCVGKDVIVVPAGNFFMGCSPLDPDCSTNELPGHLVQLSAYALDRAEVTVKQFKACKDAGGCSFMPGGGDCTGGNVALNAALPMTCMTYNAAVSYCTWAGGRLPTEAEWEKAARGGCELYGAGECETKASVYPWGNAPMTCLLANGYDAGATNVCPGNPTAPGSFAGNSPYGFLDLGGNAEEWVSDEYDETYYNQTPVGGWVNPKGANNGSGMYVLRGGSWGWPAVLMRNSYRDHTDNTGGKFVGFRCAFDVP